VTQNNQFQNRKSPGQLCQTVDNIQCIRRYKVIQCLVFGCPEWADDDRRVNVCQAVLKYLPPARILNTRPAYSLPNIVKLPYQTAEVIFSFPCSTTVESNFQYHIHRLEYLRAPAPLSKGLIHIRCGRRRQPQVNSTCHLLLALRSVRIRPGKATGGRMVVS
jgi:hypothetical protein